MLDLDAIIASVTKSKKKRTGTWARAEVREFLEIEFTEGRILPGAWIDHWKAWVYPVKVGSHLRWYRVESGEGTLPAQTRLYRFDGTVSDYFTKAGKRR